MSYCNVLFEDKRLLNRVSDARKRHLKVVISQNFPCGAERGKPPPPPSPSQALSLRRHCSSFFRQPLYPMAPHPIITYSIFQGSLVIFYPSKTEYEIETKETMQREQKVILLKTMSYCNVLCEDKRLLNRVSDARKRHLKVVISQNFPCLLRVNTIAFCPQTMHYNEALFSTQERFVLYALSSFVLFHTLFLEGQKKVAGKMKYVMSGWVNR